MLQKSSVSHFAKLLFILVTLLLLVHYLKIIIFPLLYGFFLAMALLQIARRLERIGLPRILASIIPVLLVAALLVTTLLFLVVQGTQLISDLELQNQTEGMLSVESIHAQTNDHLPSAFQLNQEDLAAIFNRLVESGVQLSKDIFSGTTTVIMFVFLVPFYTALLLIYRGKAREFLNKSFSKPAEENQLNFLEEVAHMIRRYVLGLAFVMLLVAIAYSVGLQVLDIPYAWLLGFFSAILIAVPYVGAIIGGIVPTTLAYLTTHDLWITGAVVGLYLIIQVIEGYVLTPWIVGKSIDLNPLVIILAMFLFGLVGGVMGVIIAVPLIATIKLVFQYSAEIKELASLMGADNSN